MASWQLVRATSGAAGLPPAWPRRDGAGMLTAPEIGTGHHGVRVVALPSTASAKEVKIACVPVDDSSLDPRHFNMEFVQDLYTPEQLVVSEDDYHVSGPMGDEDEFDYFYRVLSKKIEMHLAPLAPEPLAVSEEEKAVQEKFVEMATKCMGLLVDAIRRIRPVEKRRTLFPMFNAVYPVFASMRWDAEGRRADWWMALQIIEKLEVVRKVVSSACGTPLPFNSEMVFARKVTLTPLDREALAGHGVGSNLSVVIFVLVDNVYNTVKSDIDDMISAASAP